MRGLLLVMVALAVVGAAGAGMRGVLAQGDEADDVPLAPRGMAVMLAYDGGPPVFGQGVEGFVGPVVSPDFGDHLDAAEIQQVLALAGWPERLRDEAARVIAGPSLSCLTGESNGYVTAGADHQFKGIFQLAAPFWFVYAGEDWTRWADPVVNARVAWKVYQYDIAEGNAPWTQWTCKP